MNKGQILQKISEKDYRKNDLSVRVGDKVILSVRIKEEKRERIQAFEGFVIAIKHGKGINGRFTVRRVGKDGIAVERIFPLHSEFIEKIEVVKSYRVRRAKLNFIKDKIGNVKLPELRGKKKGKSITFSVKAENSEVAPEEKEKLEIVEELSSAENSSQENETLIVQNEEKVS